MCNRVDRSRLIWLPPDARELEISDVKETPMRSSGDWPVKNMFAPAALYMGNPSLAASALPRALRVVAIIARAPRFCVEEIADDLILRSQGGLRGYVRDVELN